MPDVRQPHPITWATRTRTSRIADDTMSSESAVNLDQGDPLAEADFHMAYGLYDQAADLVRIALEREPDRRDLRLKLLEIYFVWGNKDAFLQTAKELGSHARPRAGRRVGQDRHHGQADLPRRAAVREQRRQRPRRRRAGRPESRGRREPRRHRFVRRSRRRAQQSGSPLAKEGDDTAATGESPATAFRLGSGFHLGCAGARRRRFADARDAAAR